MKADTFTKTTLAVIALALVVIAGQSVQHTATVRAAQTSGAEYDYKFMWHYMSLNLENGASSGTSLWTEDGNRPKDEYNNDGGFGQRIQVLGSQGWELVSDVVFSNHGNINPPKTIALNGVTTSERLIFRRRKP